MAGIKLGPAAKPFQASAQTVTGGCSPSPSNAIIQTLCPGGRVGYLADLSQFESDSVAAYLTFRNLPLSDAALIYSAGREDLRDAIRTQMLSGLLAIINKPASQRSAHEQNLLNWLQYVVQQNEIAEYTSAIDAYHAWQADPCEFTLDPTIAAQYGLSYDGLPFCYQNTSVFGGAPVPAESYFLAYGLENSYGLPSKTFPQFGAIVANTQLNLADQLGIAVSAGALVAIPVGAYVGVTTSALIAAVAANFAAFDLATTTAGVSSGAVTAAVGNLLLGGYGAGSLGLGAAIAGPASIVLIAVTMGVAAGMQTFSSQQTITDLNNLSNTLAQVTNTPPDLPSLANDKSGLGVTKITETLIAQTLPSQPATSALPAHRPGIDPDFSIAPSGGSSAVQTTLNYQDWSGISWSAQTYGGWFVQTCNSGTSCPEANSIIDEINYLDWSGTKWTASRLGTSFVTTKGSPASTDVACPASEITGVSPGTDFSGCSSYVSSSIPLKDVNGNPITVSINVPPVSPSFSSPRTLNYTAGAPSSLTITAAGSPTPAIVLSSATPLPAGFTFAQTAPGTATLSYAPPAGASPGTYPLTFTASSTAGTTQPTTFTVNVTTALQITSAGSLTVTAGIPVNFTVTTTGFPIPALSISSYLIPGLQFTDHGNGTGSITGTPQSPPYGVPLVTFCLILGNGCGVTATNAVGSITQPFSLIIDPPPSASLVSSTATFVAGIPNAVRVTSTGAITPVSYMFSGSSFPAPSWLNFQDNGDGTGILSGTPPAGTEGQFTFMLLPQTSGAFGPLYSANFTLNVNGAPIFTSSPVANFTVGTPSSFEIDTNGASVSAAGFTFPQGLAFEGGSPAYLSGTPASGTGGVQTILLTAANNNGSATQTLTINTYEAPHIQSSNTATFLTGQPNSFAVTTTGYPSLSTQPLAQNGAPPTSPTEGEGMYFTVTGLPSDLQYSNLNAEGQATGTLTIQGTPSAADAGLHQVQIIAQNGVGAAAQQTLELNIIAITGAAPASGTTCNGNYNGTFKGSIRVSAGQNCTFIGGGITGSVTQRGGNFVLGNTTVSGNVDVQGSASFSFGPGTVITGNLAIGLVASGVSSSQICDAKLMGNVQIIGNATPLQLGSASPDSCPGNYIGGNLAILANTGALAVFNNDIGKNLSCLLDSSINGAGNIAASKQGQCAKF